MLTVTRHLAQEVSRLLVPVLSRELWARVAVADYRDQHPQSYGEKAQRPRRFSGYARMFYGPLHLTDEELAGAVVELRGGSSY